MDLSTPGIEAFRAQPYKSFIVHVDDEPVELNECFMTPVEILQESGKESGGYYQKQVKGHKAIFQILLTIKKVFPKISFAICQKGLK